MVRHLREGMASVGVCWDTVDMDGLQHRPYRRDRLALAVHPEHSLAARKSIRFEQTLDHEHVGLPPASAMHTMRMRAAGRAGRTVSYRVIVSNFDAAFWVVAANLAVSIVPFEVGGPYARMLGVTLIPLAEAWAQRRFSVCFQNIEALQPASRRMAEHLVERAAAAEPA